MVRNLSLKTRMALSVSLLFVVFSATIAYFSITYMEGKFKQSLADQQYALACALADDIDNKLVMLQQTLLAAAAKLPPAIIAEKGAAQSYLDNRITLHTLFDTTLFLLNKDGIIVAESPVLPERRIFNLAYREYFQKTVVTGKPVISSPFISSLPDHRPVVMLTVPVFDGKGRLTCVLCGGLRLLGSNLLSDVQQKKIGTTGYIYLSTAGRTMIMHPDNSRIMKLASPPGANKLFDKAMEGFEGSGETVNSRGIHMLVSFKHLRTTDWILGLNFPISEAYAPMYKTRQYLLGGIAAGTLAMLVIAWLVMKRLTAPLQAITRHVAALPGKIGTEILIPISSKDEIGTLAQAFNGMVVALDEQQKALRSTAIRAEEEKARTEAIIAAIGEGIIIQDREFRILYQNAIHKTLIGDHLGEYCYRVYQGRDTVCEECPVEMAFADGSIHTVEKTILLPGKMINLEVTASPLRDVTGEIIASIELVRDISERKRIEEEIIALNTNLQQKATDLAAANCELEAFGYSLSHDLKGPLTAIYSAAQTLEDIWGERLDDNGRFCVESICKASERMEKLLEAMLLLSMVSRSDLQLEEIDLSGLVMEILSRLQKQEQNRAVEFTIAPQVRVSGDPYLLTSALENLLGNAWKYTRKRAVTRIEFGESPHNGTKAYFVRDNGAGFDMKNSEKMFIPFHRLHQAEEFEGMGIGLTTVQRIIQRHGGELWGEGEPDKGATFYFTMPGD